MILLTGGLVAGGVFQSKCERCIGLPLAGLFHFERGPLLSYFKTLFVTLAFQLALVIRWVRSRGPNDFSGRYRIWKWVALTWLMLGISAATNLPIRIADTLRSQGILEIPNSNAFVWLFLAGIVGGPLLWKLDQDMRSCRTSRGLLWLGAISGGATCILQHPATSVLEFARLAAPILSLFAYLCLFLSMLVHARFVIHISPDPPIGERRYGLRAFVARLRSHRQIDAAPPKSTSKGSRKSAAKATNGRGFIRRFFAVLPRIRQPASKPLPPVAIQSGDERGPSTDAGAATTGQKEAVATSRAVETLQSSGQKLRVDQPGEQQSPHLSSNRKRRKKRKHARQSQ